ncbi:MAG: radical SAM protein [Deltaproteobacteria bacterium]|nr:radical SAM protein [Deltaproteobacteria bacterium]
MSDRERHCACGAAIPQPDPAETRPVVRLACPACGRSVLASRYEKMDVALSEECNFHCIMCRRPPESGRLSAEEVFGVMEQAAELGMKVISFCGGEPFVHPEILPILQRAFELGLAVQLTTNGSLVKPEMMEQLAGLDCLTVSIDALGPTHDAIRRHPGAFEKACRTLKMASAAGITCGTNTVIQRANAAELLPLFEHLLEITGGRLHYVRHAPVEVVPETAELMVSADQVPELRSQLGRIAAACDRTGVFFCHRTQLLDHLELYLDKWTRHRPLGGCAIPRKFIGYSHLGFYLCWHQGHSIRARSLIEALESATAAEVASDAAGGRCPGCNALTYSWDEEWNAGILAGKLVIDGKLPDPDTTIHGEWAHCD